MSHHVLLPSYQKGQEPQAIDRSVLSDLRVMLGEEGSNTLADLIDLFLSDVPSRFHEIHQIAGRGEWEEIKPHIDFLRGWCETLGAREVTCCCKEMELFFQNIEVDPEAGFNREDFSSLLHVMEEAFARAASELMVLTAEY
ncbi:MAG: Hpt domain-containing protein [Anaerolineaceae bacterium]